MPDTPMRTPPTARRNRRKSRIPRRTAARRLGGPEYLESRVVFSASPGMLIPMGDVANPDLIGPGLNRPDLIGSAPDSAGELQVLNRGTIHARIVNGTPTNEYESAGIVGDRSGGFCSGTLITSTHALTAGHCAVGLGDTAGRFTVGGQTYATSRVVVHPGYNDATLANDIAIFELDRTVVNVTPTPIFRGTPYVGQELILVGFGAGGTGTTGHNGDFGTKRVGRTPIDGVTATEITWRFDNNSESNTAPGDSGGPAYVDVRGQLYVAGVTSGGDRADAGIGDNSYDTRVDAYAAWIDSITGSTPSPDPDPDPDPDPAKDDHVDSPGSGATEISLSEGGAGLATGQLETSGDRDVFQINLAGEGLVTVAATRVDDELDTYLRIYDEAGRLVAENDDFGGTLNSQVTASLNQGRYYVSVGSYADAGTGRYRVDVHFDSVHDPGPFPEARDVQLDSLGNANTTGVILGRGDSEVFSFVAGPTGRMVLRTRATSGNLDTILRVYDAGGNELAFNDDWRGLDSRVRVNVVAGERYYVQVTGFGGTQGPFRLTFRTQAASTRQADSGQRGVQVLDDSARARALAELRRFWLARQGVNAATAAEALQHRDRVFGSVSRWW